MVIRPSGLLNHYSYTDDANKATDSRWLHRPPMDWDKADKRNDPSIVEARIHQGLKHLLWTRKSCSLLRRTFSNGTAHGLAATLRKTRTIVKP